MVFRLDSLAEQNFGQIQSALKLIILAIHFNDDY